MDFRLREWGDSIPNSEFRKRLESYKEVVRWGQRWDENDEKFKKEKGNTRTDALELSKDVIRWEKKILSKFSS